MPGLESYVLIGLPASEAHNALLTPLAGHEFGHSIWALEDIKAQILSSVSRESYDRVRGRWEQFQEYYPRVTDEKQLLEEGEALHALSRIQQLALRQSEEIFCDLVGLYLFGEAYLHAFAYLLAPGPGRHPEYPSIGSRVSYLLQCAPRCNVTVPDGYTGLFIIDEESIGSQATFLLSVADEVAREQVDSLQEHVSQYMQGRQIATIGEDNVGAILRSFELVVPPRNPHGLPEVLNAGWRARHNPTLWASQYQINPRREQVLNELLLKTAEVLEVQAQTDGEVL